MSPPRFVGMVGMLLILGVGVEVGVEVELPSV